MKPDLKVEPSVKFEVSQKSATKSENSGEDDIKSLCSEPFSDYTRSQISSVISNLEIDEKNNYCFSRFYNENSLIPSAMRKVGPTVRFDPVQDVQEFHVLSENESLPKQAHRGTNNPWRRYGALKKLHEIGGYVPQNVSRSERKNRDLMTPIKKGTKPPKPPGGPQMKVNKVCATKGSRDELEVNIKIPKGMNAKDACIFIAEHIQKYVFENGSRMVN